MTDLRSNCSKCGDGIVFFDDPRPRVPGRWFHVDAQGRCGRATEAQYQRHVDLGCFNAAQPPTNEVTQ